MLSQTQKANKKLYRNAFLELRDEFIDIYSQFNINIQMSMQDKMNEINKYSRFERLTNKIAEKLVETNKQAVNGINILTNNVYQTCYNITAEKLGIEKETKTESKKEVKENENPYQTIAVDKAKDYDQASRSVASTLLNAIVGVLSPFGAFISIKETFEKNLNSSNLMATQQTTIFENMSVVNALFDAKKKVEKNGYILIKKWNSMKDAKVRDAHARADGQEAELDKPFYVGGEQLMYPGDPNGSLQNIMNCRCWITYDLVKKNKNV